MTTESDAQLLRAFAESGAEAAFTELVQRHTDLVYSAAWRQVESADVAREITQTVFIDLARSARALVPRLAPEASLAGWLCRSARNQALNHLRDEFRRQTRERHAMEEIISTTEAAPDWEHLSPMLDDAMAELTDADYDALVLRYFQNRDFRSVGTAIGVSDDTAQKRVTRALDKLRELLAQRGLRTTAGALGLVMTANAVQSAPAGLAATISAAGLTGTAAAASTIIAATKTITMTTLQKTLVTATVAVLAGAGIYETRQATRLRYQVEALQQQQAPLAEQIQQLESDFASATNRLADLQQENSRLKADSGQTELLKLQGEIGRLRRQLSAASNVRTPTNEPDNSTVHPPGTYLTKEQIAFAGYSTPEAAYQSFISAILNTNLDKVWGSFSPSEQRTRNLDANRRKRGDKGIADFAVQIKGLQIVAIKTFPEMKDAIDLKIRLDTQRTANDQEEYPQFVTQSLFKFGTEWRLMTLPFRPYTDDWNKDGQIQQFVP